MKVKGGFLPCKCSSLEFDSAMLGFLQQASKTEVAGDADEVFVQIFVG